MATAPADPGSEQQAKAALAAVPPHEGSDGASDDDALQAALALSLGGQLSFAVGGKQATGSSLRVVGGKIELDGQFAKGEAISVRLELVVNRVAFVDKHDAKTGQVVGCERQHHARVTGIRVVE